MKLVSTHNVFQKLENLVKILPEERCTCVKSIPPLIYIIPGPLKRNQFPMIRGAQGKWSVSFLSVHIDYILVLEQIPRTGSGAIKLRLSHFWSQSHFL